MEALARRALAVTQTLLALGNEVTRTPLGTFVRNRSAARIWDANHVAHPAATTPAEVDRLLAAAEEHFAGLAHRRVDLDDTPRPSLEARLVQNGYGERRLQIMVLDDALRDRPKTCDIRPIADEAGWAAFTALRALAWTEEAARLGLSGDPTIAAEICLVFRAKSPAVRWWLAYEDGEPCGCFASWEGVSGVGQIEDLFVHPGHRHRGIATALVHHCVADCRARGAAAVVLVVDPTDTPRHMYVAMGFRLLTDKREYLRHG
jgi:ribosomal protein S18 acetylase RimI-like enzyme